jgi:hypothetical protein
VFLIPIQLPGYWIDQYGELVQVNDIRATSTLENNPFPIEGGTHIIKIQYT